MADIRTESLTYDGGSATLQGHLAYDAGVEGPRPGVLVVHEWWGLNDYIRERARQVAELGFSAFAIDMYGGGKTADNPDDAGALMNAILQDMSVGTARLEAAYATLEAHDTVDGARMAAIGYCFGGAMVLHMARIGMPLKAVVSFHGALGSFYKPAAGEVKAKVLVCHGADDEFISEQDIRDFRTEMETAGASYELIAYKGALHGFTSRDADDNGKKYGLPLAYNKEADEQSWLAMQKLFREVF